MNTPKHQRLVVLHIPKTAGTSLRGALQGAYGPNAGYWYGRDDEPLAKTYAPGPLTGRTYVGGHKRLSFYPPEDQPLYCAIVRHPAERVASYFSYVARPQAADDNAGLVAREIQLSRWLKLGIKPDSLVESIKQSAAFRKGIRNTQCDYLSRGKADFASVRATVEEENFVIAETSRLQALTDRLGLLFHWPGTPDLRINAAVPGVNAHILQEPGAAALVAELTQEDQKLYDFITGEHEGLYENLPALAAFESALGLPAASPDREPGRYAWDRVDLQLPDRLIVGPGKPVEVSIRIHNHSREYLNPALGAGLFFGFRLLNGMGENIGIECQRTRLNSLIAPGDSHEQQIRVLIPPRHFHQVSAIKVSMIHAGKYWIDQLSPSHPQVVSVTAS